MYSLVWHLSAGVEMTDWQNYPNTRTDTRHAGRQPQSLPPSNSQVQCCSRWYICTPESPSLYVSLRSSLMLHLKRFQCWSDAVSTQDIWQHVYYISKLYHCREKQTKIMQYSSHVYQAFFDFRHNNTLQLSQHLLLLSVHLNDMLLITEVGCWLFSGPVLPYYYKL